MKSPLSNEALKRFHDYKMNIQGIVSKLIESR